MLSQSEVLPNAMNQTSVLIFIIVHFIFLLTTIRVRTTILTCVNKSYHQIQHSYIHNLPWGGGEGYSLDHIFDGEYPALPEEVVEGLYRPSPQHNLLPLLLLRQLLLQGGLRGGHARPVGLLAAAARSLVSLLYRCIPHG